MRRYILLFLLFVVIVPGLAFAQNEIKLNLTYPSFGGFNLATDQDLPEIIAFFYYFIIGISGLAAFVMLIWGGVEWLASGAIPARASEARDKIRSAILGLLLILASFLIIQVINPELTTGLGPRLQVKCSELDNPGACDPLFIPVADGATLYKLPKGESRDGIYLCKREQCTCEVDPCKEGNNPDNDDYWYLDAAALGLATGAGVAGQPGITDLSDGSSNWNDKVQAIAIKGDFGVLLTDDPGYAGTAVCFDSGDPTKGGRLNDFMRLGIGNLWGDKGAQSLKALAKGKCKSPGITLFNESDFWNDNIVFLFRNIEQGRFRDNNIRYGFPIDYIPVGATISSVPFPTRSIYVAQGTSNAAIIRKGILGLPAVCFRTSVADLSEYDWNPFINPPDDILNDIGSIGVEDILNCPPEKEGAIQ